jgi:hypothetical protein
MKNTKLTIALAISGLLIGLNSAKAFIVVSPTYTYEFEAAASEPTVFNGSTITIDGTGAGVTAFSFYDTDLSSSPFTTAEATGVNAITSYDATGWTGEFEVGPEFPYVFDATGDSMDEFSVLDIEADPFANGVWYNAAAGVPDASNTFLMLLGGLATLVGVHFCNRSRVLAFARS